MMKRLSGIDFDQAVQIARDLATRGEPVVGNRLTTLAETRLLATALLDAKDMLTKATDILWDGRISPSERIQEALDILE